MYFASLTIVGALFSTLALALPTSLKRDVYHAVLYVSKDCSSNAINYYGGGCQNGSLPAGTTAKVLSGPASEVALTLFSEPNCQGESRAVTLYGPNDMCFYQGEGMAFEIKSWLDQAPANDNKA